MRATRFFFFFFYHFYTSIIFISFAYTLGFLVGCYLLFIAYHVKIYNKLKRRLCYGVLI